METAKTTVIQYQEVDPAFSRVVRAKLEHSTGCEVFLSANYDEALQTFEAEKPVLMLIEPIMEDVEGRNGFDLIRAIRASEAGKDVIIVVLTELAQDSDKQLAKEAGADHYYVKSLTSMGQLIKEIQKLLGGSNPKTATTIPQAELAV